MRAEVSRAVIGLLTALLAGCASEPPRTSWLDSSGLTVVTHDEAILLARPVPTLAAAARDYAVVGPVEINRAGTLTFYLWVGLASTVDRERIGRSPPVGAALALIVDDEPMVLPLAPWEKDLDHPPYVSAAPIYAAMAAHTTLDQIHRIAASDSVSLHIITRAGTTATYRAWQGDWSAWTRFPIEP